MKRGASITMSSGRMASWAIQRPGNLLSRRRVSVARVQAAEESVALVVECSTKQYHRL